MLLESAEEILARRAVVGASSGAAAARELLDRAHAAPPPDDKTDFYGVSAAARYKGGTTVFDKATERVERDLARVEDMLGGPFAGDPDDVREQLEDVIRTNNEFLNALCSRGKVEVCDAADAGACAVRTEMDAQMDAIEAMFPAPVAVVGGRGGGAGPDRRVGSNNARLSDVLHGITDPSDTAQVRKVVGKEGNSIRLYMGGGDAYIVFGKYERGEHSNVMVFSNGIVVMSDSLHGEIPRGSYFDKLVTTHTDGSQGGEIEMQFTVDKRTLVMIHKGRKIQRVQWPSGAHSYAGMVQGKSHQHQHQHRAATSLLPAGHKHHRRAHGHQYAPPSGHGVALMGGRAREAFARAAVRVEQMATKFASLPGHAAGALRKGAENALLRAIRESEERRAGASHDT